MKVRTLNLKAKIIVNDKNELQKPKFTVTMDQDGDKIVEVNTEGLLLALQAFLNRLE